MTVDSHDYERRPKRRGPGRIWLIALLAILLLGIGVAAGYLVLGDPSASTATPPPAVAQPVTPAVAPAQPLSPQPVSPPSIVPEATPAENPASAAAPATPAAPAAPATPATPSQPQAAATPEPAPPSLVKAGVFGDWVLVCPEGTTRGASCLLQQQLRSKDTATPVFLWVLRRDADGIVHAIWQMPSGVDPKAGLTMDIGDGKPRKVPFSGCTDRVCTVQASVAADYLQSLQQAQKVVATVALSTDGKPAQFALSARGMADGLTQLATP